MSLQVPKEPAAKSTKFDTRFIKVLLKTTSTQEKDQKSKEVFLLRSWIQQGNIIPHFANVIKGVGPKEGVEITMNCNVEAFEWIIDLVKVKTNFRSGEEENLSPCKTEIEVEGKIKGMLYQINTDNCLNKLVTSHFLQIWWIYEAVWE